MRTIESVMLWYLNNFAMWHFAITVVFCTATIIALARIHDEKISNRANAALATAFVALATPSLCLSFWFFYKTILEALPT